MGLIDYRALLINCDEVLVDRDAGVWSALQPLLESRTVASDKDTVLALYNAVVRTLYTRFDELGFSGLLCFAHRQLAEQLGIKASWEEGMSFARSVPNWMLFEDAPGAMLYLRKFYRLLVYADRDPEDRGLLCERLGLPMDNILSQASHPINDSGWLQELGLEPQQVLLISRPAEPMLPSAGLCFIRRKRDEHLQTCAADYCINSMADLVAQHQLSLRC